MFANFTSRFVLTFCIYLSKLNIQNKSYIVITPQASFLEVVFRPWQRGQRTDKDDVPGVVLNVKDSVRVAPHDRVPDKQRRLIYNVLKEGKTFSTKKVFF